MTTDELVTMKHLQPGDLLLSHTDDTLIANDLLTLHRSRFSHLGLYDGKGGRLDCAPGAGARRKDVAAVMEDPRLVRLHAYRFAECDPAEVGEPTALERGQAIVDAARRDVDYSDAMLATWLEDGQGLLTVGALYQILVTLLTVDRVDAEGVAAVLGRETALRQQGPALFEGHTCSGYVADAVGRAARDEGWELKVQLNHTRSWKPENLRLGAAPPTAATLRFGDDVAADAAARYRNLLIDMAELARDHLPRPSGAADRYARRAGEQLVLSFDDDPAGPGPMEYYRAGDVPIRRHQGEVSVTTQGPVYAAVPRELPAALVGNGHLEHAMGLVHLGPLVPDVHRPPTTAESPYRAD